MKDEYYQKHREEILEKKRFRWKNEPEFRRKQMDSHNRYIRKAKKENPLRYGEKRTKYRRILINTLGGKCQKCGSTERLEIHELRYDLDITIADCQLLCRKCHMNLHHRCG